MLRVAVLISGAGSTLQNFIRLKNQQSLDIEIPLVISSRRQAGGLKHAHVANLPTKVIEPLTAEDPADYGEQIASELDQAQIDLVCMAGFLSFWQIPAHWMGKVMNIHPSLLPAFGGKGFYGLRVHQAVLDAGCKITGCTVHFADNEYDHGPIILQEAVPVNQNDTPTTLSIRVCDIERKLYPEAIRLFASNRIRINGRKVTILD